MLHLFLFRTEFAYFLSISFAIINFLISCYRARIILRLSLERLFHQAIFCYLSIILFVVLKEFAICNFTFVYLIAHLYQQLHIPGAIMIIRKYHRLVRTVVHFVIRVYSLCFALITENN